MSRRRAAWTFLRDPLSRIRATSGAVLGSVFGTDPGPAQSSRSFRAASIIEVSIVSRADRAFAPAGENADPPT